MVISQKELTRYDVLRRVLDGTISLKDAAGYMKVSYRQAIRLKKYAEEGAKGLDLYPPLLCSFGHSCLSCKLHWREIPQRRM